MNTMDASILLPIVGIGLLALLVWALMRWRYVRSLRQRGWEFDTSPTIDNVIGLNHAPFGAGFGRKVDDMVYGLGQHQVPFKAIEYEYKGWKSKGYVVMAQLSRPLPFCYITSDQAASSVPGKPVGAQFSFGNLHVNASDPDYGRTVAQLVAQMLPDLGHSEFSVDHANVVLLDVKKGADSIGRAVDALTAIAAALPDAVPAASSPPAPPHLSFNHSPHWHYTPRDDTWLSRVSHTRGGDDHEARDVVWGMQNGIDFVRLTHHWTTETTDSDGDRHTQHHKEHLCEFRPRFAFGPLSLGSNPFGISNARSGLQFESAQFNKSYKVQAYDPKFASDVLHPRMMEWLLKAGAPRLDFLNDGRIQILAKCEWSPGDVHDSLQLLTDFFARVPDFVWDNLGVRPRPVPEYEW